MWIFENKVLRRIFGPKTNEETEEWRRLYNEELYVLYSTPDIIQGDQINKTEMDRAYNTYGGDQRCIQGFGEETYGKEAIGKTHAQMRKYY